MTSTTASGELMPPVSAIYELRRLMSQASQLEGTEFAKLKSALETLHHHVTSAATAGQTEGRSEPSLAVSDVPGTGRVLQQSTLRDLDQGVKRLICSMSSLQGEIEVVQAWYGLRTSGYDGMARRTLFGNPKWSKYDVDNIHNAFIEAEFTARCDSVLSWRAGILLDQVNQSPQDLPGTMTIKEIIDLKDGLITVRGGRAPSAFMSEHNGDTSFTKSLKQWRGGRQSGPPGSATASTQSDIIGLHLDEMIAMCKSLQEARDWVETTVAIPSEA